ncbi:helix-turn-helix domain-containing protein [Streptomyces sp. NPDC055992]|uniref:helix-turn-helix domain-containing protein n=1 Tax=Streptomyces sp. NPDC055992 TaxID=3345673 RepID=UPI0035DDC0C6
MQNERLRAAMAAAGWTHGSLAEEVGVDPKSVERWVNLGRVPRRKTAVKAAEQLGEDVYALWPALRHARPTRAVSPEVLALYDQRADLPVSALIELFSRACDHIDILVYAAVHLHEAYPRLNALLGERAAAGCTVRIALGDADSENVSQRGREERFGLGIESRCRLALMHFRPLVGAPGVEVRTHGTTLYNSLYRVDDQLLANTHVWGVSAYAAPFWHLRRQGDKGLFATYAASFDAVWSTATPVQEG